MQMSPSIYWVQTLQERIDRGLGKTTTKRSIVLFWLNTKFGPLILFEFLKRPIIFHLFNLVLQFFKNVQFSPFC